MPSGSNNDLGLFTRVPGVPATVLNADLIPSIDVSNYKWLNVYVGSDAYAGTLTFQGSYDNFATAPIPITLYRLTDFNGGNSSPTLTNTYPAIYGGPVRFQYFRVRMTSYTSGTATGLLELRLDGLAGMQLANIFSFLLAGTYYIGATNNDGTTKTVIAAGTVADTVILASKGMLARVLVTTLGTSQMNFYDNASAGSGDIVGIIPASATAGTIVECKAPCPLGITAKGDSNNPAVTVFYTPVS